MGKCRQCGKKRFFLKLDPLGLCPDCSEEYNRRRAEARAREERTKTETFKIAGTSFYQKEIKSLGMPNDDYSMGKRDLIEIYEGEKVFALDFDCVIKLVPEPDNEHDKNAIRVEADGVLIGYVPKGKTKRVRELMAHPYLQKIDAEIEGGKYKYVGTDFVDTDSCDFYAKLIIKYEERES